MKMVSKMVSLVLLGSEKVCRWHGKWYKNKWYFILLLSFLCFTPQKTHATCDGNFLNPITEVCWSCMFPIKIGGITVVGSDYPDTTDAVSSPICFCPGPAGIPVPGISISFWEPVKIIEVVKDPGCFPSLGLSMEIAGGSHLSGTLSTEQAKGSAAYVFMQAHEILFPVFQILDILIDFLCRASGDFDIAYITELDPTWNNDMMAMILNPEALVFGNPVAQLSCIADSLAATSGVPRDELFWCMGNWGSAYPLAGGISSKSITEASAAIAARLLYKLHRMWLVCDRDINPCQCSYPPIWNKSHWRLQPLRPKAATATAVRIGEPVELWGANLNPAYEKGCDNFAYVVFRKVSCCAIYLPE